MDSLPKIILEAARTFGDREFTRTEIVLAAWKLAPARVSLPGASEHPDSNKVTACLVGKRGLIAHGYLDKVGPNRYRLVAPSDDGPIDYRPGCNAGLRNGDIACQAKELAKGYEQAMAPSASERRAYRNHPSSTVQLYVLRLQRLGRYLSLEAAEWELREASRALP